MYLLRYVCFEKNYISSYSLETNKILFRTFLGIEIDVLDNFSIKNDRSFEIVKYPSLDHGALYRGKLQ